MFTFISNEQKFCSQYSNIFEHREHHEHREQLEHLEHREQHEQMNSQFKYILAPYTGIKSRTTCPACQKRNQFALYIDIDTKEPLSATVGRCNREVNCGYHYTPKQYFEEHQIYNSEPKRPPMKYNLPQEITSPKIISSIPFEIFNRTRQAYDQNNFFNFLAKKLGNETALDAFKLYHVGTSKHWPGATIFWQIDIKGRIRAGKVMLYNSETGHRIKEPFPHITWIHKLIVLKDYNLSQCLFGEHLLKLQPEKPTAIVESEKTAILAAAYLPEFNWLASGNLNNLSRERCQPLKGKSVILFPDAGALEIWKAKAATLKDLATFIISDIIENNATAAQLKQGFDLADYLKGQPLQMFTARKEFEQTPEISSSNELKSTIQIKPDEPQEESIEDDNFFEELKARRKEKQEDPEDTKGRIMIEELEKYFNSISIDPDQIDLGNQLIIKDPIKFIDSHLTIVKANAGKGIYKLYLDRLIQLKEYYSNKY